jgi:predicted nucleotidyltransferase
VSEFWQDNLILQVRSGSRAHGLAQEDSDEDSRGVCIPPKAFLLGLQSFEQYESQGGDHVIYALAKFARLALGGNPNIIETLFTEAEDVLHVNSFGQELIDSRHIFLSRRVGERFSGYAIDQLKRMERHHRWLVEPPPAAPDPAEYGATLVDGRQRFADRDRERAYQAALKHWNHYEEWRRHRNPKRAALEEAYGYDTKHAMHLCRLLKMGHEILAEGAVRVRRPDADWLRSIRAGAMSYDKLIEYATEQEAQISGLVRNSALPDAPDEQAVENLVIALHERFLAL